MAPPAPVIISIPIPIPLGDVIILRRNSAVRLNGHDFDEVVGGVVVFSDVQEIGAVPPAAVVVVVIVAAVIAAVIAAVVVAVVIRVGFVVEVG